MLKHNSLINSNYLNYFIFFGIALFLITCSLPTKKVEISTENTAILAYQIKAQLGEGAIWNYKTQELFWIDIEGKKFHIYYPKTKLNKTLNTPTRIGTVVPKNEQEAIVALEDGIYNIDIQTGDLTLLSNILSDLATTRFNDGKCDPSGRLWVGSMELSQEQYAAKLYMIDAEGNSEIKIDSVTISNGIVWTANKKTMYYIDTPTSTIKAYDFDNETGTISNGRIAVEIPQSLGFPDGMTIDEEDMLWVGMWNGNAVIRFNPTTGTVISKIDVPAHNITSCAFGGENLDTLYITTASIDMTPEEIEKYPLAGSLFKVVPGVKGVKNTFFSETNN